MKKEYLKPDVAVDIVVLSDFPEGIPKVLLIKRRNDPFAECWAIPGGYLDIPGGWGKGETVEEAAYRELLEETSLSPEDLAGCKLKQFKVYSDPKRDPRSRVISIVFYVIVPYSEKLLDAVKAGDDAKEADWFPINQLPPMAFDHALILQQLYTFLMCGGK
jgi:8-oxo-dGTP diphosphatase